MKFFTLVQCILSLATLPAVLSHGDPDTPSAIARRDAFIASRSSILQRSCASRLQTRASIDNRAANRDLFINKYLSSRGLAPDYQSQSKRQTNTSCILAPEQEEGPYYIAGELIREDIRESQPGVDLLLDVELLNVHTCEPIEGVLVDFWACNSTGVYAGFAVENTVGETYLRGLQASDSDGVVQVLTKFPGWYQGRTQHIHIKAHVNYTISGSTVIAAPGAIVHTGQVFFEQSLLTELNVLSPYSTNKQAFTLNSADHVITSETGSGTYNPYLDITLTDGVLADGAVGTITIGIDPWVGGK